MVKNSFHERIIKLVRDFNIPKNKKILAIDLYLTQEITLLKNDNDFLLYIIDDKKVSIINKEEGLLWNINGSYTSKNEYLYACLLAYKRDYYIKINKKFDSADILSTSAYYFSNVVNAMNYDDYKVRFVFYYGLIEKLTKLQKNEEALKMMIDFFCFMETHVDYDRNAISNQGLDQYNIVRNRIELFVNNAEVIPSLFDISEYSVLCLGKLIYIIAINNLYILKNKNLEVIYKYVLTLCSKKQKKYQLYELLQNQRNIIKWYNKELDDDFMKKNLDSYDVLCCYVNYLDENKRYGEIRSIYENNNFRNNSQNILAIGINSFYENNDYEEAIRILLKMDSITFKIYKSLKERFPNLFTEKYIDTIIEYVTLTAVYKEAMDIIKYENKEKYILMVYARDNFNSVDEKLNEYLGKYDDLLLKIYQKEVVNKAGRIRGYYDKIPEELLDLFTKMEKMQNGKYYIVYIINYIMEKNWLSYRDNLREYCKGLLN